MAKCQVNTFLLFDSTCFQSDYFVSEDSHQERGQKERRHDTSWPQTEGGGVEITDSGQVIIVIYNMNLNKQNLIIRYNYV